MITGLGSFLWEKTPKWVRWVVVVAILIFYTPIKIREELIIFIDSRAWAVITPVKEKTDSKIIEMESDIGEIKQDIRDVKNYLLYKKRPDENRVTEK